MKVLFSAKNKMMTRTLTLESVGRNSSQPFHLINSTPFNCPWSATRFAAEKCIIASHEHLYVFICSYVLRYIVLMLITRAITIKFLSKIPSEHLPLRYQLSA